MSKTLIVILILAGLLAVATRLLVKPHRTLSDYRRGTEKKRGEARQAVQQANAVIPDAEALRPVLAALRDLPLPPETALTIEDSGTGEAWLHVERPGETVRLFVRHKHLFAPHGKNGQHSRTGLWIVRRNPENGAAREETFSDLAACVARLQSCIIPRD